MRLATILIFYFVITSIVGGGIGSYVYYEQSNDLLVDGVVDHLESIAQLNKNFILEVLREQGEKLRIVATHQDLSIKELTNVRNLQEEFSEVFVLDSQGIVTFSSDESQIGKDKSSNDYFVNVNDEAYFKSAYFSSTTSSESIAVSTPFNDGVLVARIDLKIFDEFVFSGEVIGETAEVLLGYKNDEGNIIFFTERRFEQELSARNFDINLPIEEALEKNEDVFLESYDYRNVKVIAVTKYIEEIGVGMVVKVDEAEAFEIVRNELLRTSIFIILGMILLFSFLGFIISYLISRPLKRMTSNVDAITKGELDIQLQKSSINEVQKLTDSLNRILASLKLAILKTSSAKGFGLGDLAGAKKEAEDKYKLLYESSRDAIMILEAPSWNFSAGNPATVKLFGAKDEKEFISKTPGDLSPVMQPDRISSKIKAKEMIEMAMKKGSISFDWVHKRVNGEEFPARVHLVKMKLNGKDVLHATVREMFKTPVKNSNKTKVVK